MGESVPTPADEPGLSPIPFTPEERAEYERWQKLGHQAWAMIDEWERDEAADQLGEDNGT